MMDDHTRVSTMLKWTASAPGVAAGTYAGYVGETWLLIFTTAATTVVILSIGDSRRTATTRAWAS